MPIQILFMMILSLLWVCCPVCYAQVSVPSDGVHAEYYSEGSIKSEKNYKNGILSGVQREYYKSGKLHLEWNVLNGQLNGSFKTFREDGSLKVEDIYDSDQLVETKEYNHDEVLRGSVQQKDGNVQRTIVNPKGSVITKYNLAGMPNRTTRNFYSNGNVRSEKIFINETEYLLKTYLKDGTLASETPYKDNLRHGIGVTYYPENGAINYQWAYQEDMAQGLMRKYFPDGTIEAEAEYKDSMLMWQKNFDENGKLLEKYVPQFRPGHGSYKVYQ